MRQLPKHLSIAFQEKYMLTVLKEDATKWLNQSWIIPNVDFVPAVELQTTFSLPKKFLSNLGNMQRTSTHALPTSRKHMTGFLVKSFEECWGSMVLLAVKSLYSCSEVCVHVGGVESQLFIVGAGLRQGYMPWPFPFRFYMIWIDSHSRVGEDVTFGKCRINRLCFTDDLVLLASSQPGLQHALDRFPVTCDQAGNKINTERTNFCVLSFIDL